MSSSIDSSLVWWVVPGVIGGMPMPRVHPERRENQDGNLHAYADELPILHSEGVRGVVCLLNLPGDEVVYRSASLDFHLMVVPNGMPPTVAQTLKFLAFMKEQVAAGHPVAVHCEAGLGRTGTVIASYLIATTGCSPESVIDQVRDVQPQAIETKAQVDFLLALPAALTFASATPSLAASAPPQEL